MIVLVINCGSSSIKYQIYDMPEKKVLAKGLAEKIGEDTSLLTHEKSGKKFTLNKQIPNHKVGIEMILSCLTDTNMGVLKDVKEINAVGHRVVHGGETYSNSVIIDQSVLSCIEDCADLAPLHNPPNMIGIVECRNALPNVPMVAVFDTAFHQTLPKEAYLYGLPYNMYEKYRIRKYGFHGTSHCYVTHRTAELLNKKVEDINMITCHLGNGCSMAAIKNGKSIDTTMGFTPLAGVMMGTRSGDIDPAIIFYLSNKAEFSKISEIDKMLNKKSGLLGISGISNDMRDLEASSSKDPTSNAKLAIDIFCYRVRAFIGQYMILLGRIDAIAFMGGIGENDALARKKILANLENFGVALDENKNNVAIRGKEGEISLPNSKIKVMVVPTNEEGWIAQDTYDLCKNQK